MAYGLQLFNADGASVLNSNTDTFTRVIHSQRFAWNFTGTASVPDFDDTRGMFYVSYFGFKVQSGVKVADSTSMTSGYVHISVGSPVFLPALNWNNATKLLSCSPHTVPSGFTVLLPSDYNVTFLHYG